jgi:hypothetical protein
VGCAKAQTPGLGGDDFRSHFDAVFVEKHVAALGDRLAQVDLAAIAVVIADREPVADPVVPVAD